jgi:hypothetical protein
MLAGLIFMSNASLVKAVSSVSGNDSLKTSSIMFESCILLIIIKAEA